MSRPRMFGPAVCRLRSAESGPQPCSGRLITPAAGWRGASMSIHMYQHRRSLARRSRGTMAQLSVRLVVRPVVRLVVARPMVRLEARPVYHRRSPAAPDPYCVPAGPSMVLEETVISSLLPHPISNVYSISKTSISHVYSISNTVYSISRIQASILKL